MAKMTHLHTDKAKQRAAESRKKAKRPDDLAAELAGVLDRDTLEKVRKRLNQMPESARLTYVKAMSGKSAANGIKAMCSECMGWDKSQIAGCTAQACPLFPYRPYKD